MLNGSAGPRAGRSRCSRSSTQPPRTWKSTLRGIVVRCLGLERRREKIEADREMRREGLSGEA